MSKGKHVQTPGADCESAIELRLFRIDKIELPNWATAAYGRDMAETDATTAAGLLRELRTRNGQTLRAAADDLGVAASHLSRLERGEKAPSPELTGQLAHYYRVDREILDLEQGRVPADIIRIFQRYPDLLQRLRREYGDTEAT